MCKGQQPSCMFNHQYALYICDNATRLSSRTSWAPADLAEGFCGSQGAEAAET